MKPKLRSRVLAALLSLVMLTGLMPGMSTTVFAQEEYTLTYNGRSDGIKSGYMQIYVDGKDEGLLDDGESIDVSAGSEVRIGYWGGLVATLLDGWNVDGIEPAQISDATEITFTMPEGDVNLTANMQKLETPNASIDDNGIVTWDAVEGYVSEVWVMKDVGGHISPLFDSERIEAANGKYTYDLKSALQRYEAENGPIGNAEVEISTAYWKLSDPSDADARGQWEYVLTYNYSGAQKLATPANPRWDGFTARWNPVEHAAKYEVMVYSGSVHITTVTVTEPAFDLHQISDSLTNGETYNFRVSAIPEDSSTEYMDSEYSEKSVESDPYQPLPDEPVDYHLVVNKVKVTSENAADILGDRTAYYDPDTKTLTLNNAVLDSGIYGDGDDLTVNVVGENTINITDTYGIALGANALSLQGSGTLKITEIGDMGQQGIWAKKVTIDGVTLSINSTSSGIYAEANYGATVEEGDETVNIKNGAELNIVSGQSAAISAKEISIEGSTVTAETTDTSGNALYAWDGGIEINNSTVNAYAKSSSYPAVWANTSVEISGGSIVTAVCGEAEAVYTNGAIDVTDSTVNVSGNIALYAKGGDITLTNTTTNITETTGTAIFSPYNIKITGGSINGGSSDGYTIYSPEAITINGTALDIQSGTYGIASYEPIKLENVSGTIAVENAAIWAIYDDLTITDCDLTLSGDLTVNAGDKNNLVNIQITDSELTVTGVTPLYVAGDMTIMDSELTVTATERPIVANYGTLTIDGAKTDIQATGGQFMSGTGVNIKNGNVNISVTVAEDDTNTSMGAIFANTGGITISGGTVNASIGGKAGVTKIALITGGDLNITGGTVTMRGDYPMFISANGGGSLNFGSKWYQWADSALGTPVLSTETPYTYEGLLRGTYLRFEPIGTKYSLTVESGEGSGSYTAGSRVPISAEPYNGNGHFSGWTVTGANASDILVGSTTASTTVIMPAANVTVTANYANHVLKEHERKAPTCTETGNEQYWECSTCHALFADAQGSTTTTMEAVTIAQTGHDWSAPVWDWSDDGKTASATFTCRNDSAHTQSLNADITSAVKTPATCTGAGMSTCTARVTFNGTEYSDQTDVVVGPLGHSMQKTDRVDATCTTPGKEAYYTCETCGKHFEDEAGNTEIANLDEYGIIPATDHEAGTEWKSNGTSHWNECLNCGEKLNEADHTFAWETDKEATATEAGSRHEECTVCGYEKAAVEIPATGTAEDPSEPPADNDKPSGDQTGDTTSPQTGDDSNIALWIAVLFTAGAALTGTALYSRKRKYSR